MVLRILKSIIKVFVKFYLYKEDGSKIIGNRPHSKNFKGRIRLSGNSSLVLGNNIQFNGTLIIGNNSEVTIEDGCIIKNAEISILNNSIARIGKETVIDGLPIKHLVIYLDNGNLNLEGYNKIMSEILVRFGGVLTIGKYTGIGYHSEIRCEESITIGSFGLFSYEVCIYDTDTHSTNWEKRRERIIVGYPVGTAEVEKPNTKPVFIGNDVWLGKGVTIAKGTKIGDRCIVGIRTVVGSGEYPDETTIVSDKPRIISKNNG